MYYTELEIVGAYERADDKKAMLKILQQLNACPLQEITEILEKHGYKMDYSPGKKGKKKNSLTAANQTIANKGKVVRQRSPRKKKAELSREDILKSLVKEIKLIHFKNVSALSDEVTEDYLEGYKQAVGDLLVQLGIERLKV